MVQHRRADPGRFADRSRRSTASIPGFDGITAKGIGVFGSFESNGNGVRLQAAVFEPGRVPVIGRFSLDGGQPYQPDRPDTRRGLGLQFSTRKRRTVANCDDQFPCSRSQPEILFRAPARIPRRGPPDRETRCRLMGQCIRKERAPAHPDGRGAHVIPAEPRGSGICGTPPLRSNTFRFTMRGKTLQCAGFETDQPFEAAGAAHGEELFSIAHHADP